MKCYSVLFVLLCVFLLAECLPYKKHHSSHIRRHHRRTHGTRHHRQIPHYPARNEKSAAYCGKHEHHVTCGPEKHCDKSCENMYSPPHCEHDNTNPKCYFPRCLCNEGFVRSASGRCIRPSRCPNRYMEPKKSEEENADMLISFQPLRIRHVRTNMGPNYRKRVRKVRHFKPAAQL